MKYLRINLSKAAKGFLGNPVVKNPPVMQEMQVQTLDWEDPLEKEMVIHSSILPWEIPWTEEPGSSQKDPRVIHFSD